MLISGCEIFAPKPVSHSHTGARKDTLLFLNRRFFCFFLLLLTELLFLRKQKKNKTNVGAEQRKGRSEMSPTAGDKEEKSGATAARSFSLYPTHTLDSQRERSRRHLNSQLQPREEERHNLNSHKAAKAVLFLFSSLSLPTLRPCKVCSRSNRFGFTSCLVPRKEERREKKRKETWTARQKAVCDRSRELAC